MADTFEKPTAHVSAADGGGKTVAPMPMMQNQCFLCGQGIGEAEPRQFYEKNMLLAHTGCLNKFQANGETWPEEKKEPSPRVDDLGDVRRASYGNARLTYTPRTLSLSCDDLILQHGLKAVIPDLIVALRAVEASL